MTNKDAHLAKQLKTILETEPHGLRAAVAQEVLEYGENSVSFFTDLMQYGCQSGMVSSLIYYCDTHRFYDRHYDEIEALRMQLEEDSGEPLHPKGDLKNWYAWMAFEETARKMMEELDLAD